MGLTGLHKSALRTFGPAARRSKHLESLGQDLQRAHMGIRPEAYLAYSWMLSLVGAVAFLLVGGLLFALAVVRLGTDPTLGVLLIVLPGFGWYTVSAALLATPASTAKKRGKDIDHRLPYATNYIAAMASAGVIPAEVFKSLARQEVYGEVTKEAAWIYKDLEVHGKDIVTALRRAIDRTPSMKFQDMLQGAITTISSGGDLTGYFQQKAKRLQWENRVEQKSFIDTMGIMAESYVTAAVAGPLFLLVMVSIFVLMGSGEISMMQLMIFVLLPVINIGFIFGLKSMIPEV